MSVKHPISGPNRWLVLSVPHRFTAKYLTFRLDFCHLVFAFAAHLSNEFKQFEWYQPPTKVDSRNTMTDWSVICARNRSAVIVKLNAIIYGGDDEIMYFITIVIGSRSVKGGSHTRDYFQTQAIPIQFSEFLLFYRVFNTFQKYVIPRGNIFFTFRYLPIVHFLIH